MLTTVASPLTRDQMIAMVDDGTRPQQQPSPWRQWVVRMVLQPLLWAAWVRSKVVLREEW
jgi:hypothetical protein